MRVKEVLSLRILRSVEVISVRNLVFKEPYLPNLHCAPLLLLLSGNLERLYVRTLLNNDNDCPLIKPVMVEGN